MLVTRWPFAPHRLYVLVNAGLDRGQRSLLGDKRRQSIPIAVVSDDAKAPGSLAGPPFSGRFTVAVVHSCDVGPGWVIVLMVQHL